MKYQWHDLLSEASNAEPDFVHWNMAQELVDPKHVGKDRSTLYATKTNGL